MAEVVLRAKLPINRDASGQLFIEHKGVQLKSYEALGRGSQGSGDTQLLSNGNTPTGKYDVTGLKDTSTWPKSSYGPNGALKLDPIEGNAVRARDDSGRRGLLIHGGDLGGPQYWRGEAELRATHGCLRLSNESMADLVDTLRDLSRNETTKTCDMNKISVIVQVDDGTTPGQYFTPAR